jgi:transcriptional regulator with XRE-family HTH domain
VPNKRPKEGSIRSSDRSTLLPRLRDARKRQGLTQRELAALAGTGAGTISDLEVGRRGGYPATVKRLCRALDVTPAQLMTDEHPSNRETGTL